MKAKYLALGVATLMSMGMFASAASAASTRYTILYKNDALPNKVDRQIAAAGGTLVRTIPQVGIAIAVSDSASFGKKMSRNAAVAAIGGSVIEMLPASRTHVVEENGPTTADIYYNAGMVWGVDRIHAPAAWAAGYTGSHDTVVAVIDTGIAWNHPDLVNNVVYVNCFNSAGSLADGACDPYPSLSYHGTHVAGTVAASFGGGKVVGVAPNAGLAGYNVFEEIPDCGACAYSDSRWIAMVDAADHGFAVINMSLGGYVAHGGPGSNDVSLYLQVERKIANYVTSHGTVIVSSAGNENQDLNGVLMHVPGDIPATIDVGATGIQPNPYYEPGVSWDTFAFYSNYGAAVDVSAPGGDCGEVGTCSGEVPYYWYYFVFSTYVYLDASCAATHNCPTGYSWAAGTSMASPHVAGVAALVKDANPRLSAPQVKSIIKRTADNIGNRQLFGHGVVDAAAAVEAAH